MKIRKQQRFKRKYKRVYGMRLQKLPLNKTTYISKML